MCDWKPGDLALCVKIAPWTAIEGSPPSIMPRAGRVYTVKQVALIDGILFLNFADIRGGYHAARFRKIHPHQEDADDREVIALLTYAPLEVGASS